MKAAEDLTKSKTYEFGGYRLEAESLSLFRGEKIVQLPPKTIEVLLALVESGGRVVSREEINERVWADTFVEEANLTHHVSALRKIFNETGGQFIETVPRRGYRFVADVREIAADKAAATTEIELNERTTTRILEEEIEIADALPTSETLVPAQTTTSPTAAKKLSNRWRIAAMATLSLVALGAIGFAFYKFLNFAPVNFEAKKVTRLTSSGRVKTADVSSDGKFVAYSQEEAGGQQSLWVQHIGSDSKTQIAAPARVEYYGINISPDGNHLYYVNGQNALFQIPILGGAAKKIVEGISANPYDVSIGISPDGKRIAFVRYLENEGNTLFIADNNGANAERLITSKAIFGTSLSWSPDGETIACRVELENGQNILAVRVADGVSHPILQPKGWATLIKAAWLPDSKSLAAIGWKEDSFALHIYRIGYPNGEVSQITEDRNNYFNVNATADGHFLAAVRTELVMNIWTMPSSGDAARARQLTDGFEKYDAFYGLDWLPDNKIVYSSLTGIEASTWAVEARGGIPKRLMREGGFFLTISPDGRFVIYQKNETQKAEIGLYRTDLSDGTEKQLTTSTDIWATVSPDGKWIFYTHYGERTGLWKISIDGGEPTLVFQATALCPAVSPDGKTVAFIFRKGKQPPRIALVPSDGGEIIRTFDAEPETYPMSDRQNLQWTQDGRGVYFVAFNNGVSNIWQQPIDGSPPAQMTDFKDGRILNFAFSADGKQLALSRGTFNSDVVLIEKAQ